MIEQRRPAQPLLHEPRGYPCQNADFVLPPTRDDALFGLVIAEQANIWPAMSGHNTICVATALLETGMVLMTERRPNLRSPTSPAGQRIRVLSVPPMAAPPRSR